MREKNDSQKVNAIEACGTWTLKLWDPSHPDELIPLELSIQEVSPGVYAGQLDQDPIDGIECDPSAHPPRLAFSRKTQAYRESYQCTIIEGVLVGKGSRIALLEEPGKVPVPSHLRISGWNREVLDQELVPRVYRLVSEGKDQLRTYLTLRIDRDREGQMIGRCKAYAQASSLDGSGALEEKEGLEYDLEDVYWDGESIKFSRRGSRGDPVQTFSGTARGNTLAGVSLTEGKDPQKWMATRCGVFTYGLTIKTGNERTRWQEKTRRRLKHLMMAEDPVPSSSEVRVVSEAAPALRASRIPRDDAPLDHPQAYTPQEIRFRYLIPDAHGGDPISRETHAWLATPTNPPSTDERYRGVLALHGHRGSAFSLMFPGVDGTEEFYWYGEAFARRGYVVLALDLSHRALDDREHLYKDYAEGDDPSHGNLPKRSIQVPGEDFSEWVENGERAWDAMRALDYLISLPTVDPREILVTGFSMGGEIASLVSGMDPRVGMCIAAGYSPDLAVMKTHGNHPCWSWGWADMQEYVDAADIYALIAPRPLVIETGKEDRTYSSLQTPFASDKQVARRIRTAYGDEKERFIHYLHDTRTVPHEYCVGDLYPGYPELKPGVQMPVFIQPDPGLPDLEDWQVNGETRMVQVKDKTAPSLFDCIDVLMERKTPPPGEEDKG